MPSEAKGFMMFDGWSISVDKGPQSTVNDGS